MLRVSDDARVPLSRRCWALAGAALALAALTACMPLAAAGRTSSIAMVSSTTADGWRYDFYRNRAYPCSISGYQTFAIGTKVGSSATATRPLWVKMRGGGFGWFDDAGRARPSAGNKTELTLSELLRYDTAGLMAQVKGAPEGFRTLLVSMCSHDIYGGMNTPDPHNPNTVPGGGPRPTNGLISTKAAIQFTTARYPTDDYFLHGTSAGAVGTFHVAWGLQQQGIAPAGVVADSGVIDQTWQREVVAQDTCGPDETLDGVLALLDRIDPDVADPANQPDETVRRGALTVPVMHVWNHGDLNSCGPTPMQCMLRDGTTVTMGASDCRHEALRDAIADAGPGSRSVNMPVCVEGANTSVPCDRHVVTTTAGAVNTDPASPADYQSAILDWVRVRLTDD